MLQIFLLIVGLSITSYLFAEPGLKEVIGSVYSSKEKKDGERVYYKLFSKEGILLEEQNFELKNYYNEKGLLIKVIDSELYIDNKYFHDDLGRIIYLDGYGGETSYTIQYQYIPHRKLFTFTKEINFKSTGTEYLDSNGEIVEVKPAMVNSKTKIHTAKVDTSISHEYTEIPKKQLFIYKTHHTKTINQDKKEDYTITKSYYKDKLIRIETIGLIDGFNQKILEKFKYDTEGNMIIHSTAYLPFSKNQTSKIILKYYKNNKLTTQKIYENKELKAKILFTYTYYN